MLQKTQNRLMEYGARFKKSLLFSSHPGVLGFLRNYRYGVTLQSTNKRTNQMTKR